MTSSDEIVEWDHGAQYSIGWELLVALLTVGIVMNIAQLLLHWKIKELQKLPNSHVIVWLACVDLTFDLLCLITCSANLHYDMFWGGVSACTWQGFYAELLMGSSGAIICSLLYNSYITIVLSKSEKERESIRTTFSIQSFIILYCLMLSIIGTIYPGQSRLNAAGTFCYPALQFLPDAIIFYIGYVGPELAFLIIINRKISSALSDMEGKLRILGKKVKPRPLQVLTLRTTWSYVIFMLICYAPFIITSVYMWISGSLAPSPIWILAGLTGHLNTLMNPILYYILSPSARKAVLSCFYSITGWEILSQYREMREMDFHQGFFEFLIASEEGRLKITQHAEEQYCNELTLFLFDDYDKWLKATMKTKTLIARTGTRGIVDESTGLLFEENPLQRECEVAIRVRRKTSVSSRSMRRKSSISISADILGPRDEVIECDDDNTPLDMADEGKREESGYSRRETAKESIRFPQSKHSKVLRDEKLDYIDGSLMNDTDQRDEIKIADNSSRGEKTRPEFIELSVRSSAVSLEYIADSAPSSRPISRISSPSPSMNRRELGFPTEEPHTDDEKDFNPLFISIYSTYIAADGPLPINIPSTMRETIDRRVTINGTAVMDVNNDPNPETIFDEVAKEVKRLLYTNAFQRLLRSDEGDEQVRAYTNTSKGDVV